MAKKYKLHKLQKRPKTVNINNHPVLDFNKAYMPIDIYACADAISD